MTIQDDIGKIPRKLKNGMGGIKITTSIHVDANKFDIARAIAKSRHVSISGVIELALDRLFAEIDREV
jgi:hypothetical protein